MRRRAVCCAGIRAAVPALSTEATPSASGSSSSPSSSTATAAASAASGRVVSVAYLLGSLLQQSFCGCDVGDASDGESSGVTS